VALPAAGLMNDDTFFREVSCRLPSGGTVLLPAQSHEEVSVKPRTGDQRLHGEIEDPPKASFGEVHALVRRIPAGRVMTYGQIAVVLGSRLSPRAVGWALHGCPEGVPWQRVVNASGGCSTERMPDVPPGLQRRLLEEEGISFEENGTLNLGLYRWSP